MNPPSINFFKIKVGTKHISEIQELGLMQRFLGKHNHELYEVDLICSSRPILRLDVDDVFKVFQQPNLRYVIEAATADSLLCR
jgi:hypothetical protein